jgi:outer membrane murein-binding lipoprotein Lpp
MLDQWLTFAQDRWFLIIAAVIVLFIVIGVVKTVLKWVLIIVIVGALVLYGANYKDKLQNISTSVVSKASTGIKDEAVKALTSEAKEAKYQANADGTFTITTKSLKVEGKAGSNDVKVTFLSTTFTLKADGIINAFIEQAKANSKS